MIPRRLLVLGRLAGEVEPDGGDEPVIELDRIGVGARQLVDVRVASTRQPCVGPCLVHGEETPVEVGVRVARPELVQPRTGVLDADAVVVGQLES